MLIMDLGFRIDTSSCLLYSYVEVIEYLNVTTINSRDDESGLWVNYIKNEVRSSQNGLLTSIVDNRWDSEKNEWRPHMKMEVDYGEGDRVLSRTLFRYNTMAFNWEDTRKKTYSYYPNGDLMNIKFSSWDYFGYFWLEDGFSAYHYRDRVNTTGLRKNIPTEIRVYPNPANSWLRIDAGLRDRGTYHIYNLQGMECQSGILSPSGGSAVDISSLVKGMYVIQVQLHGGERLNGRFVKQ